MQDSKSRAKLSSLMFYQIFTAGVLTLTAGGLLELRSYKSYKTISRVSMISLIYSNLSNHYKHNSDKQTIL